MVHHQEDDCIEHRTAYTDACKTYLPINTSHNRLPEDESSGSKYVEDIKNKKLKY